MAFMKRLIPVALMVAGLSLPVFAQRGGGRSGGLIGRGGGFASHSAGGFASHAGAFAGHSAPVFRAGSAPLSRSPMRAPQFSGSRYMGVSPDRRITARGPSQNDFRRRRGFLEDDRLRRPYVPFFSTGVYGYPGWIDPVFLGYSDYPYDDSGYVNAQPPANYPLEDYDAPPAADQADAAMPLGPYRPAYQRPLPPSPEPQDEAAVTLVFKDGRPSEQIHNYMLTRTTLYVQEQRIREIPLDQLDLAATIKVNKEAGVDFQLPGKGT
jgi:hypothetical protein